MFIAHQKQRDILAKMAKSGRWPQALLFSGQTGIGKKLAALEFIKTLNNGKIEPSDFLLIEPQNKQIQIEQIRDLQKELSFKPQFALFKTALIDKAEALNLQAQNCLLKTLEEPPGKALFILISAMPEMLLPTIRSRCQILKFYPPKQEETAECLNEQTEKALGQLLQKSLAEKFSLSQEQAEDENLGDFFENLLNYLRKILKQKLAGQNIAYTFGQLKTMLEATEETRQLLASTNVNPRLTLENLMLNL